MTVKELKEKLNKYDDNDNDIQVFIHTHYNNEAICKKIINIDKGIIHNDNDEECMKIVVFLSSEEY